MSRPTFRLKSWSVPPSSTSAFRKTESYACASGYRNSWTRSPGVRRLRRRLLQHQRRRRTDGEHDDLPQPRQRPRRRHVPRRGRLLQDREQHRLAQRAPFGGGVATMSRTSCRASPQPNPLTLSNTIVAGSLKGGAACDAYLTSEGGNLAGQATTCFISIPGSTSLGGVRDRQGADPKLDALADERRATLTHPPRYGASPSTAASARAPRPTRGLVERPRERPVRLAARSSSPARAGQRRDPARHPLPGRAGPGQPRDERVLLHRHRQPDADRRAASTSAG